MVTRYEAPWHKASYDNFLNTRLPELLASRLALGGYTVEEDGEHTCRIRLSLLTTMEEVEVTYAGIPLPAESGLFHLDGTPVTVVALASSEDLDVATVQCVGEQLYDFIAVRLGDAPAGITWDEVLLRAWLPLDAWVREFFSANGQRLDTTNWLAAQTHLRRIFIAKPERVITPGQFGRSCPFETPEGLNIGRVFSLALGAAICGDKIIITDNQPEAALGLTASMIPFIEHSDANRLLMGCNMLRQWIIPPDPEPALVQTGNEPAAAGFWCGRNLLTAFVSWGEGTYEDGIIISESCAQRLNYPHAAEAGDKLSNRHGTKGVISRILPDAEMPQLADGTPVELIYNFIALHTRLNIGQQREAVLSRLAHLEGCPLIVPPFHAPKAAEIQTRLRQAGLAENGMEVLRQGRDGELCARPSLVGWVYWGKTVHLASSKVHVDEQRQGELEYYALREAKAWENLGETFNTRAAGHPEAETLTARVATGVVTQAPAPTPLFLDVAARLAVAGIRMTFTGDRVTFGFAHTDGPMLRLAKQVAHPWLPEQQLSEIGEFPRAPEYSLVVEANARLARMMESGAPKALREQAHTTLAEKVMAFFDVLLVPEHLILSARVQLSARSVIVPASNLRVDQLALPDEIAWALFNPLLTRALGDARQVEERSELARATLDNLLSQSWVIANRAPTVTPTAMLAFHPLRCSTSAIGVHPLACMLLNADFDGDQMAVFLPVTDAGQQEAGERLSIAGHLRRDPSLVKWLFPNQETLWGLAWLGLTPEGQQQINEIVGTDIDTSNGIITRASIIKALRDVLHREGVEVMLKVAARLLQLGFAAVKGSGASMSPFWGESLSCSAPPEDNDPISWTRYTEQCIEQLLSRSDYDNADIGPQLLAVKCEARGSATQLMSLRGARLQQVFGQKVARRHGYMEGLLPAELFDTVVSAREALARITLENTRRGYGIREAEPTGSFTVLSRARRAQHPGVVFAHAAASGEVEPLTDLDSRLLVGLPPE